MLLKVVSLYSIQKVHHAEKKMDVLMMVLIFGFFPMRYQVSGLADCS